MKLKGEVLFVVLVVVLVLAIAGTTALGYVVYKQDKNAKNATSSTLKTDSTATASTQETYQNLEYGFYFKYDSTWKKYEPLNKTNAKGDKAVFAVGFKDPVRDIRIKQFDCINEEMVDWANKTPSKTECDPILLKLSKEQKQDIFQDRNSSRLRNVEVSIFKDESGKTAAEWLTDKYKIPETELQDFQVGKEVAVNDVKGNFANIGCCDDYNVLYALRNTGYIYLITTNDQSEDISGQDNKLLQQIARDFKFINNNNTGGENVR